jgi:alpha-beta hydrolase superfamily lysophospholipase
MPLNNFTYQKLKLKDDYEGKAEATFIQSDKNIAGRKSILYIHGFVDYFFHPHVADEFHAHGFNFYALELRKYGHSFLSHQHPNYCKELTEYFEEIDLSIEKIYAIDNSEIYFLGHSTGGLITSLYLKEGNKKELISAMILNSPFLEINAPWLVRKMSIPILKIGMMISPYANIPNALSPLYPISLHKDHKGEWDFNLNYKPIKGFPAYFSWLLAIKKGQDKIKEGLMIPKPIVLMHSSASFLPKKWSDRIHKNDVVLNIQDMKKYGNNLGTNVTLLEIKEARHDIFLSVESVRKKAFKKLFDYLESIE